MRHRIIDYLWQWMIALNTGDNGRISHTKVWSNLAYSVSTWIVVQLTLDGNMSPEYFLIYLGIVASHSAASKWINNKLGGSSSDEIIRGNNEERYEDRGARRTPEFIYDRTDSRKNSAETR